jgi:hypothetical protein
MAAPSDSRVKIMLDSGAYSAWFHGAPLDLTEYIDYCERFKHLFNSIVALDQIPGANRKAAKTYADIEQAAKQSHENYHAMRRAGLDPIPVFHQGEDWKWLDLMIAEGISYIGISPYPRLGQPHILRWLDEVFTRITDQAGRPLIKTHGFGATSWQMITRYPWYSIDSTTWALAAGYGTIILPPFTQRATKTYAEFTPDYEQAPLRFSISDRDTAGARPLLKQGPLMRKIINEHLARAGMTLSDVRSSDRYRAEINAYYYVQLEAALHCQPFRYRRQSEPIKPVKRLVRFDYRPRVIFAEQMGKHEYGRALERVGASKRLISYYESRRYPDDKLKTYCGSGLLAKLDMSAKRRGSQSWIVNRRIGLLSRLKEKDPNA